VVLRSLGVQLMPFFAAAAGCCCTGPTDPCDCAVTRGNGTHAVSITLDMTRTSGGGCLQHLVCTGEASTLEFIAATPHWFANTDAANFGSATNLTGGGGCSGSAQLQNVNLTCDGELNVVWNGINFATGTIAFTLEDCDPFHVTFTGSMTDGFGDTWDVEIEITE
jgi:hypothetical protein